MPLNDKFAYGLNTLQAFALSLDGFFFALLSKFFIVETSVSTSMGINASNEHPYVPTCIRE